MASRSVQVNTETMKKERMLHIRLDPELHRQLRLIVAARDTTMQEWVSKTLAAAANAEIEARP